MVDLDIRLFGSHHNGMNLCWFEPGWFIVIVHVGSKQSLTGYVA